MVGIVQCRAYEVADLRNQSALNYGHKEKREREGKDLEGALTRMGLSPTISVDKKHCKCHRKCVLETTAGIGKTKTKCR
ncbi:hypothetical protein GW17_00032086 [Ensete ventricosum]|nr:hypothetical protein GW17_00032086 [Ensete ventricosum]RZS09121.1 hypothetical protein BHM03_00040182 [Ensete ventricosum]